MEKVFVYWDNSNIFISAQSVAARSEAQEPDVRSRVRVHFENLFALAVAGREVEKAYAVGSIPPELRWVWNRLEKAGVEVTLLQRSLSGSEQGVDATLQTSMLRDLADYNGDPGIAVLMTGDGAGFYDGVGFHKDVERMHRKGWRVEILSWIDSCNHRMKEWAEKNGLFIALDDYYESITFLEPGISGQPMGKSREQSELALDSRPRF